MQLSNSNQGNSAQLAQELLVEFLCGTHVDPDGALEIVCSEHPMESVELKRIYAVHKQVQADLAVFGKGRRDVAESDYLEGARVGDVIGDFRLEARIASGGQGEVWEASQRSLKRRVALKLVLPDRINEKTLRLFAREARAAGRLAHRGIVAVYGYGEDAGRHWICQELVEGGWTLRDFIDEIRDQPLPENYYRAVALFIAELAEALQVAHKAGIIHRDVKPQNVLVTPDDHPKLTDFGLARITDEQALSLTGDLAGTWLYMSPEQVTAKRVDIDHRTDIFSLGIVMYEMLAFKRPFDGDTTHQIAENIIFRDPPDLHKVRSRVPEDLVVICGRALEKLRESRYQGMDAFAADLRRHLGDEPIQAKPPGLLDRGVKWVRRNPTKSMAAVSAGLAFVVISGLALWISNQNTELEEQQEELTAANASLVVEREKAEKSAQLAEESAQSARLSKQEAERKAADVLRLSLIQDYEDLLSRADRLWPPHPDRVEELQEWVIAARNLTQELPGLVAKRDDLREFAIQQTVEQRRAELEPSREFGLLVSLTAQLNTLRSALSVRQGESEAKLDTPDWSAHPDDPKELNREAWRLVGPERETFGQEALGLALAIHAAGFAQDEERTRILDTVAWGYLAMGDDASALEASLSALNSAPGSFQATAISNNEKLKTAVTEASLRAGLVAAKREIALLESRTKLLETKLEELRVWRFPEGQEEAHWWHKQLSSLIPKLKSLDESSTGLLSADGVQKQHGWSVARRLAAAERLRLGFAPGGEFALRWRQDLPAIHKAYPELELVPQVGLVPIGADPQSGLWEFWDVLSGDEPQRDDQAKLVLESGSGIVFVMLPAAEFWMGAQSSNAKGRNFDPDAEPDEGPVHRVELSAFFMGKFEITQPQWQRLSGSRPSFYVPATAPAGYQDDWRHPVEMVSWIDCMTQLPRMAMQLPSEAQWEYAARAGTQSVWWTGNDRESLADEHAANLADQTADRAGAGWAESSDWPELDDGFVVHAPVDEFAPNKFGLHGMHGNVWNWCADGYDKNFYAQGLGLEPLCPFESHATRVIRGGSYNSTARDARCASRGQYGELYKSGSLSVRPARAITR